MPKIDFMHSSGFAFSKPGLSPKALRYQTRAWSALKAFLHPIPQ
jgi:hypothetical protein